MALIGDPITWVAYFWNTAGTAYVTGLTVNLTIYDETGNASTPVAMTARADGGYQYTLAGASVDAAGAWSAKAIPTDTSGTLQAFVLMTEDVYAAATSAPTAAENADAVWDEALSGHATSGTTGAAIAGIKTKTDQLIFSDNNVNANAVGIDEDAIADAVVLALGEATINVSSPVISNSRIELVKGTNNKHADGQALNFTITTYPDFTTATAIQMRICDEYARETYAIFTGSAVSATQIRFEPTVVDKADIPVIGLKSIHRFEIKITYTDGDIYIPAPPDGNLATVYATAPVTT